VTGDPPAIARLRARLALQVGPPRVVSAGSQQYVFDEASAAYAEIDVKHGDAFAVVVVVGSLPSEQFIVEVWHRFVREVWLIDTREEAVYVARAGAPPRVLDRTGTLRSAELPGVAIAVDDLFAPPS
jgi:hypothetical protein